MLMRWPIGSSFGQYRRAAASLMTTTWPDESVRRAGEQNQREGELGDHQTGTQPSRPDAAAAAARFLVQGEAEALIRRRERRQGAEDQAGDQRDDDRGGQHANVDAELIDPRQTGKPRRQQRAQGREAPRREQRAGRAPGDRDDEALGQHLLYEPTPPPADPRPNRD